ncbi:hypothetical protein ALP8811_03109 [Aliiroseovarius pelagivivens]|uniref:Uncharacterized protein n=1 Tax=Aliiroseovarius pelagivivens TaxID=1639690 RepID=A0A2R8AT12_9RHOB|nr:hypothetical protein ALP8811_03109 [Aliiroseovarius pelagivivens]
MDEELRKLNYGFTGPDRKIGAITLSSEQFQEWSRLMGTVKIGAKNLEAQLEAAMQTERYDLGREKVPDGITSLAKSHRVEMLRNIITAYKQKSRAAHFESNPELYEAWVEYERYEAEAEAERGIAQKGDRENLLLKF